MTAKRTMTLAGAMTFRRRLSKLAGEISEEIKNAPVLVYKDKFEDSKKLFRTGSLKENITLYKTIMLTIAEISSVISEKNKRGLFLVGCIAATDQEIAMLKRFKPSSSSLNDNNDRDRNPITGIIEVRERKPISDYEDLDKEIRLATSEKEQYEDVLSQHNAETTVEISISDTLAKLVGWKVDA